MKFSSTTYHKRLYISHPLLKIHYTYHFHVTLYFKGDMFLSVYILACRDYSGYRWQSRKPSTQNPMSTLSRFLRMTV